MKKLNKFWKGVILIVGLSCLGVVIYVSCHNYFYHYGYEQRTVYLSENCNERWYNDGRVKVICKETGKATTGKLDWISNSNQKDSLTVFSKDEKRGYLNKITGKIFIPAVYGHAWVFSEGLACVVKNGKLGFINPKNETIIPFKFIYPVEKEKNIDYVFSGGYCSAVDLTGKVGLINKKGDWVIIPAYDYINNALLGYRIVKLAQKYGLLNSQLKLILPVEYDHIEIQKEGLRIAKNGEQQLVAFDTKSILRPFVYDSIVSLQYGSGRNDSTGTEIMINTNCFAYNIITKWGLMKRDGTIITKAIYDDIEGLSNNMFSCTIESYKITINSNGQLIK